MLFFSVFGCKLMFSRFYVVFYCYSPFSRFFTILHAFVLFLILLCYFVLFCAVFSYLLHKTKVGVGFSGIYNISSSFRWCFWSILPQLECLELNITFVLLFWFLSISNHFLWFSKMYIRNQKSQKKMILIVLLNKYSYYQ